jgi:hypothetical protein
MPDERNGSRHARLASVRGDHDPRRHLRALSQLCPDSHSSHPLSHIVKQRTLYEHFLFDGSAGVGGAAEQRLIERATEQRPAGNTGRIERVHAHASSPRYEHARNRQPRLGRRHGKASQHRQRAGIEGVATQLVARKACAVEKQHACAAARQNESGNTARRARACDDDVIHAARAHGSEVPTATLARWRTGAKPGP